MDSLARARTLAATTKKGQEAEVPCAQLDEGVGKALLDLGEQARTRSFEPAAVAFRLAERAGRCAGSDALIGAALNALSDTLIGLGNFDEALTTARESVDIHTRLHDDVGLAEAWNRVGNAEGWLDHIQPAQEAYQRALDISTAAGDRAGQGRAWNNLSNVHRLFGELDAALDYLTKAQRVFEELGDWSRAAVVTNNIGLVYFNRGEYGTALEVNARAQELNRKVGDVPRLAASYDSAGNIYRALGDYGRALESFQQALALRTTDGDRVGFMETTHNIGLVHLSQGDYQLAIDAFRHGLRLNRELRDRGFDGEALRNIGAAAWRLGQRDRATANFRASLVIVRREHVRVTEAELLRDLGQVALAEGHVAEARRQFQQALQIAESAGDQAGITDALTALATTTLIEHRPDAAVELGERAAANAGAHNQGELLWPAQTVVGIAYRQLHHSEDARRSLEAAVRSIERLSSATSGGETLRQRFFEDKLSPYHELVELSIEDKAFGEALELAERSKARVLTQLVHGRSPDEDQLLTVDEKRQRNHLRDALYRLNLQVDGAHEKPAEAHSPPGALESSRQTARDDLAAFESSLVTAHPELAAVRGTVRPLTVSDVGTLLTEHTAAVEYVVADRELFALLVTSDGVRASVEARVIPIAAGDLTRRAETFQHQIASRDFGVAEGARALYALLLAPFGDRLAGKTALIVVPDGVLWSVPFQALMDSHGYLIERMAISYTPSLAVLREIRSLPKLTGVRTVMAMGKAQFGGTMAANLAPLPDAETQVRLIRDLYGPDRAVAFVGGDASEAQFKKAAPQYRVLHLATHGVSTRAAQCIRISRFLRRIPPGDDGRLEAWELMRLKLSADVVILAACDTGRSRIAPGEGIIGTMWALFAAGARSMVVSQFGVVQRAPPVLLVANSIAASPLMIWLEGPASCGSGFGTAPLDPLRPYLSHWAGFILVGDPE